MVVYLKGGAIAAPSPMTCVIGRGDIDGFFRCIETADLARSLDGLTVCVADYGEPGNRGEGQN